MVGLHQGKALVSFGPSRWPGPETPGLYTGQARYSIVARVKAHHWHIHHYHLQSSHMAEHSINLGNRDQLQDTSKISWPKNPEAWSGSSGKQQRSSYILTTLTVKMASYWIGHGNLCAMKEWKQALAKGIAIQCSWSFWEPSIKVVLNRIFLKNCPFLGLSQFSFHHQSHWMPPPFTLLPFIHIPIDHPFLLCFFLLSPIDHLIPFILPFSPLIFIQPSLICCSLETALCRDSQSPFFLYPSLFSIPTGHPPHVPLYINNL